MSIILKTAVPKTNSNNLYPKIQLVTNSKYYRKLFNCTKLISTLPKSSLIDKLTEKIKGVKFSDLTTEFDRSLKKLQEKEDLNNLNKKHKNRI